MVPEPDGELAAGAPVAVPLPEVVELPLDDGGAAVEEPVAALQAEVELDELAPDELGDAAPADGADVLLVVVPALEVELVAEAVLEGLAGVQLAVTGTPAGAVLVVRTG